jgi:hypothetical protein
MSFIPDAVLRKAIDVIYMKYDRDHSNTLDSNELVGCFNELLGMVGAPTMANSFVMKMILKKMDKDGDGKISKPEFLNIFRLFESMAPQQQQPQNQGGWGGNQNQGGWGGNQGGFNQPTSNQPQNWNQPTNFGNQGSNWGGNQGGFNGQQGPGSGFGY